jgi:hypothetical protein
MPLQDSGERREFTSGIEALANAIIVQACKDYRKALKRNKRQSIAEIERFFRSEWYNWLTSIDGEYIIAKLRKEQKK